MIPLGEGRLAGKRFVQIPLLVFGATKEVQEQPVDNVRVDVLRFNYHSDQEGGISRIIICTTTEASDRCKHKVEMEESKDNPLPQMVYHETPPEHTKTWEEEIGVWASPLIQPGKGLEHSVSGCFDLGKTSIIVLRSKPAPKDLISISAECKRMTKRPRVVDLDDGDERKQIEQDVKACASYAKRGGRGGSRR